MSIEDRITENDESDIAAAEAAFEAAFNGAKIDAAPLPDEESAGSKEGEAAPAAAPAPTEKSQAQPQGKADKVAADPYAGLPEAVREVLAKIPTLEHSLRSMQGRYNATARELEELKRARQPGAAGGEQPSATPAAQKPGRKDLIERLRGELPEVAEALDDLNAQIAERPAPVPAPPPAPAAPEADKPDPEVEALNGLYPDWASTMNSADFKLWVSGLPEEQQNEVLGTNKALVLAPHLKRFGEYRTSLAPRVDQNASSTVARREARATRAAAPPASQPRGGITSTMTPEEAFEAAFEKTKAGANIG